MTILKIVKEVMRTRTLTSAQEHLIERLLEANQYETADIAALDTLVEVLCIGMVVADSGLNALGLDAA